MNRKSNPTTRTSGNKKIFFENTPDVLLDHIAKLNGILASHRNSTDNNKEALDFYESILRILKMAYFYLQDTKFIHDKNSMLESQVRFLSQQNKQLHTRLSEYEAITRLKLDNRLEEVMDCADAYVDNVLSHKQERISSRNGS